MLRRSLVSTPGNIEAMVEKARNFPVDILMLDLQDGVPNTDEAKARGRTVLGKALASGAFAAREVMIRVNGPRTSWFLDDARFVATLGIAGIVVPMVFDADDMVLVERTLDAVGAPDDFSIIILVETPAAILNLQSIVEASPRTDGMIAGGLDYALGTQSLSILPMRRPAVAKRHDEDLLYMRLHLLAVARAYGLTAIDAMRPGVLADIESVRADAEYSRWLGFDGIDFYHPSFIEMANDVFTPSAEELDWCDRVLKATEGRREGDTASIKIDGRVVLPQHIETARRLKLLSQEIAAR